ncbi:hypothetical protein [Subtercola sp. YIM 133946]|uniref:hypothetical protein n=1 Tax=Subtercola sp. YIM 133946 TaxID=3118909 RepID=UPI002F94B839
MPDAFKVGDLVTVSMGTTVYRILAIDEQKDAAGQPYRMSRLELEKGGRDTRLEETSRLKPARTK